jgi:hypothetical protein
MRYLVSCLLVLPFLSSCTVIEEQYYERGYYVPAPRVEVQPNYANRHHHVNNGYRSVPSNRVYYTGGNAVVINPRPAQVVRPNNVRGYSNNAGTVHGHTGNSGTVHGHVNNSNVHGHVNNGNVHGHAPSAGNVVQHPQANGAVNHVKPNNGQAIQEHQQNSGVQNKAHGHS